jgi:cobalt-zinc-cadmium efflux system membrane fusion protein
LPVQTVLRGEIRLDADRVAHVAPRIAGAVTEVRKNLGDRVEAGEVLAVLASRELAELKAAFLAAKARQALAQATFDRERDLWKKQISAEQDYLNARSAVEEARIAVDSAEQQLHAVGLPDEYVTALPGQASAVLTRYEVKAPFAGEVIEKHIVLGEIFKDDVPAFIIADLDTVWADFSVYQKDLALVRIGQQVQLSEDGAAADDPTGTISYIGPIMGQDTRTATARVVLDNMDRRWLPGQYVSARVAIDELPVEILIPKAAMQTVDGKTCAFVQTSEGFSPTPVRTGRENQTHIEVLEGLTPGQAIVTEGAFVLKASLEKDALGHQH